MALNVLTVLHLNFGEFLQQKKQLKCHFVEQWPPQNAFLVQIS